MVTKGKTAATQSSATSASCPCSATRRPTAAMAAFLTLTITSNAAHCSALQSADCKAGRSACQNTLVSFYKHFGLV